MGDVEIEGDTGESDISPATPCRFLRFPVPAWGQGIHCSGRLLPTTNQLANRRKSYPKIYFWPLLVKPEVPSLTR